MTLKPFGAGSRKTSKSPQKPSLKAFGSKRGKNDSPRSTTSAKPSRRSSSTRKATGARTPKLQHKPWNERLSYLVQRGYVINKRKGEWVVCDRFSNVQDDEPVFDNPVDAQKHVDGLNKELFDLRLKELTGV